MLTKKQKEDILDYHNEVCRAVIITRKECQRVPLDGLRLLALTKRVEGRLIAIRRLADILEISLPNRDDIIV
jgi:hypothetical protein